MNWLKQNWIKIGIGVIILGVLFFIKENKSSPNPIPSPPTSTIAHLKDELCKVGAYSTPLAQEISFNEEVVKDRFVQYLRIALNNWLSGKYDTISNPRLSNQCEYGGLVDGLQCPDTVFTDSSYGISKIEQDYLKSKFIVFQTDPAPFGGESIVLMFKDKPDKVFYAWVYRYYDKDPSDPNDIRGFDLRALNEYDLTENKAPSIEETQKMFINQLCNEGLGI